MRNINGNYLAFVCILNGYLYNMKHHHVNYHRDRKKLTFYFVAESRIDFRELVKDLFKIYKTRIWMCAVERNGNSRLIRAPGK